MGRLWFQLWLLRFQIWSKEILQSQTLTWNIKYSNKYFIIIEITYSFNKLYVYPKKDCQSEEEKSKIVFGLFCINIKCIAMIYKEYFLPRNYRFSFKSGRFFKSFNVTISIVLVDSFPKCKTIGYGMQTILPLHILVAIYMGGWGVSISC